MKNKKRVITWVVILVIAVLLFAGYNLYRYPALFRSLSDQSSLPKP